MPEVLELVEQETLVELQPELLIELDDSGVEVVDAAENELLLTDEASWLLVEQEVLTVLLDAAPQGPPGMAGDAGEAGALYVYFPAAVPVGGHRAVRLLAGEVVYADNSTVADANLVLGITVGAAVQGALVQIQTGGLMTEPSWAWTPDQPIFLGSDGGLTQVVPAAGFSLILALAISMTQVLILLKSPLVLS